jgi:hypothetical protein
MAIVRAAVGDTLKDFDGRNGLSEVWEFVEGHMTTTDLERAIVLMDEGGATLGQSWDRSLYLAHWETVDKMQAYLDLAGFDQPG